LAYLVLARYGDLHEGVWGVATAALRQVVGAVHGDEQHTGGLERHTDVQVTTDAQVGLDTG